MLTEIPRMLLGLAIATFGAPFTEGGTLLGQGCNACNDICQVGWHWDECGTAFMGWTGGSCWYRCEPGTCAVAHPQNCPFGVLTPGEIDRVLAAAAGTDRDELRVYLSTTDAVTVNEARNALQVLGCQGSVLASVAIPGSLAQQLARLAPRRPQAGSWLASQMVLGRSPFSHL